MLTAARRARAERSPLETGKERGRKERGGEGEDGMGVGHINPRKLITSRLLMVDGEEVSSVSPKMLAEERIMGARGTRVILTVMKVGGEKVFVELTRR